MYLFVENRNPNNKLLEAIYKWRAFMPCGTQTHLHPILLIIMAAKIIND